ncbi:hypothetical protein M0804_014332 [Polistes exclamans]|nr:hypothetical protein M0804_014333 [Polistes exclamans]KAI4475411.1 hypothetical protein M0804_014332 [Polistes exclamans]
MNPNGVVEGMMVVVMVVVRERDREENMKGNGDDERRKRFWYVRTYVRYWDEKQGGGGVQGVGFKGVGIASG